MKKREFPHSAVILLVIIVLVTLLTYVLPSVSYEIITDPSTGQSIIDESTVVIEKAKGISILDVPSLVVGSVSSVLPTIVLLCCCNGAFNILLQTGMFDVIISKLCKKFAGKESTLLILLMSVFSVLGLIVPPHCFVAFVPTVIALAVRLQYDYLVGLGVVLFGATIASMSGPLSTVTVMCQQAVGLPAYSGIGLRLLSYVIFLIVTIIYLLSYAKKVKSGAVKGYYAFTEELSSASTVIDDETVVIKKSYIAALILLAVCFGIIVYGSTFKGWKTDNISALFCVYAIVAGLVLGNNFSKTATNFIGGVRGMASTSVIISLAAGVTTILKQSGLFSSAIYYSSKLLVKLPSICIPIGILIIVSLMNVVLPSGPAKGVLIMPLLGPVGVLSGFSMQSSVLAYTFGDSFSNYLLPYDSTNASYLSAANVPFNVWAKFILKLFLIWNVVGVAILEGAYLLGYGPF